MIRINLKVERHQWEERGYPPQRQCHQSTGKTTNSSRVLKETKANRWVGLCVCTPPRRRRLFCHETDLARRLHLSFLRGSGRVWTAASARGSENPPLPLSAPANKETTEAVHVCPDSTGSKITTLAARSYSPCATLLKQTLTDYLRIQV